MAIARDADDSMEGPTALIVSHDHRRAAALAALALEAGATPIVIGESETGAGALTRHTPRVAVVDADYSGELGDFFFHLAREVNTKVLVAAAGSGGGDEGLLMLLRAAVTVDGA